MEANQNGQKGREDSSDSANIEILDRKPVRSKLGVQDSRNQKARNDKKDIDPDETSGNGVGKGVKKQDGDYSNSAYTINVGSVFRVGIHGLLNL